MATTHQKVEQGARSREALLDAAIELIADGGYTATGVDAIARGMSVLPLPPDRVEGLATLALQVLTGAFFEYFANPEPELLEQRLKVIRKMLALFVEHEIKHPDTRAHA